MGKRSHAATCKYCCICYWTFNRKYTESKLPRLTIVYSVAHKAAIYRPKCPLLLRWCRSAAPAPARSLLRQLLECGQQLQRERQPPPAKQRRLLEQQGHIGQQRPTAGPGQLRRRAGPGPGAFNLRFRMINNFVAIVFLSTIFYEYST
jgi:hypothetical protein